MRLRLLLLVSLAFVLTACGGSDDETAAETQTTTGTTTAATVGGCAAVSVPDPKPDGGQEAPKETLDPGKTYRLAVETNCGAFTIELDQAQAPKTTASLVTLAKDGFFDGTTFHRVVPGFVIQGGDPTGSGTGGPGYKTVDVPPQTAAYTAGVVAMAKAGQEPAGTSGSQFFVVTGADVGLPPDYAIVGTVTEGMDSVSAIEALGVGDGPPSQPVVIEKVTVQESSA
jgi:cyclophilin family peptidyl-prolyl cis-trans isomerase